MKQSSDFGKTPQPGRASGVPAWSLVAAVVKLDGGFEIFD
jgi:hypothetical protein